MRDIGETFRNQIISNRALGIYSWMHCILKLGSLAYMNWMYIFQRKLYNVHDICGRQIDKSIKLYYHYQTFILTPLHNTLFVSTLNTFINTNSSLTAPSILDVVFEKDSYKHSLNTHLTKFFQCRYRSQSHIHALKRNVISSASKGLGWSWGDTISSFELQASKIWKEYRQCCCRGACQISEQLEKSKPKSRGFETSRGIAVRRLSAELIELQQTPSLATCDWKPIGLNHRHWTMLPAMKKVFVFRYINSLLWRTFHTEPFLVET